MSRYLYVGHLGSGEPVVKPTFILKIGFFAAKASSKERETVKSEEPDEAGGLTC